MEQVVAVNGFQPPLVRVEPKCNDSMRLEVSGEIDVGVTDRLDAAIRSAVAERPETLVIDLSATTFIDSAGVHTLLAAHELADSKDVKLRLVPAPAMVQRIFAVTCLEAALPFTF